MNEAEVSAVQHCPKCQGVLRAGAKFCSACGAALDPAAEAPAPQLPEPAVLEAGAPEAGTPAQGAPAQDALAGQRSRFDLHWSEIKLIAWLYGALLLASLIIGWVGRNDSTPWTDVGGSIAEVVIVFAFVGFRYRDVVPLLVVPQGGMRSAIKLVSLSLGFVALMQLYFYLLEKSGVDIIQVTEAYQEAGWGIGVMLLTNSLIPAVTEELAFRGIIQATLERIVDAREALLIQAALFSVLHLLPMMFPSHFIMGLFFGFLRLRTKSIYPGMALHAAWNALVVLQEVYSGS